MGVMFADDFGGYGYTATLMLNGLWASGIEDAPLVNDPDPLATGRVWHLTNHFAKPRRVFLDGAKTVVGVAERIWLPALPGLPGAIISMLGPANQQLARLVITATGVIEIWKGNAPTAVATPVPVIPANAWTHVEVKFTAGVDATGAVEVRVNGVTVLAGMEIDIGDAFYQVQLSGANVGSDAGLTTGVRHYVKDFVCWDNTGPANNNFLGTVAVIGRTPNQDVSFNWSPSTGVLGYPLLDNSPPLDGTEFISAAFPAPAASEFGLTPLPDDITVVKAQIVQVRTRKTDGGEAFIQAGLVSDGTLGEGEDRPITTAFTYYEDVFDRDPDGDVAWTVQSADDATVSINRTA